MPLDPPLVRAPGFEPGQKQFYGAIIRFYDDIRVSTDSTKLAKYLFIVEVQANELTSFRDHAGLTYATGGCWDNLFGNCDSRQHNPRYPRKRA